MATDPFSNLAELGFDTSVFGGGSDITLQSMIDRSQVYDFPFQVPNISEGGNVIDLGFSDPLLATGGPVDFPSARPTTIADVLAQGIGLAEQFIQPNMASPLTQVPATIPVEATPTYTLRAGAVACPPVVTPGGHLRSQHPRKQQVKARKSAITPCVTNRHMNSLNPHALRRATRRLNGFMHHVNTAQKAIRHALGHTPGIRAKTHRGTAGRCYSCGRSARSCVC